MKTLSRMLPTVGMLALCVSGCAGSVDDKVGEPTSRNGRAPSTLGSSTDEAPNPGVQSDSGQVAHQVANPADARCEEAGFRVEYVRANGIPVRALCVDDATGTKCDTWAFYREECSLVPAEQDR